MVVESTKTKCDHCNKISSDFILFYEKTICGECKGELVQLVKEGKLKQSKNKKYNSIYVGILIGLFLNLVILGIGSFFFFASGFYLTGQIVLNVGLIQFVYLLLVAFIFKKINYSRIALGILVFASFILFICLCVIATIFITILITKNF